MRAFITVLLLIFSFQSWTKADDISDFEIEGMSLRSSALKYFSKEEIIKNKIDDYKSKKYSTSSIKSSKYEVYSEVQISYKTNDSKYIIVDINGIVTRDYKACLNEIKSIALNFDKMFPTTTKRNLKTFSHPIDKTGDTKISDIFWQFTNGDLILVACYNWNSDFGKKNYFDDELRITIGTKEFDDFLINDAY